MKAILGAIAVLFAAGCASTPARPLHYAIAMADGVVARDATVDVAHLQALRAAAPNDFLWFERDGVGYIVSDAATVARAQKAADRLDVEYAVLRRSSGYSGSPEPSGYLRPAEAGGFIPPPAQDASRPHACAENCATRMRRWRG